MPSGDHAALAGAIVDRLCQATNDHDLEALTSCFALDYRNETPVHPARGFQGRGQVRRNWEQIFAAVPDLTASVEWVVAGDTVWSEWVMRGNRRDGSPHHLRGVILFGVDQAQLVWARFYLEPVQDADGRTIDAAVRVHVGVDPDDNSDGAHGQSRRG
jgi:ketosteroid isomerase-like protein